MMKPLRKDICRCYGEDCDRKLECLRYQTIRVDPVAVYSYSLSLMPECGECESFLPVLGIACP
jgi:hypothetical protein